MVIGTWRQSPLGAFADVMVEDADGVRTLLAPNDAVAEFVSETYTFDHIELGPVDSAVTANGFTLSAPGLTVSATLGGPAPFDWLLRLVPAPLAAQPVWLRAINPIASRLVPGVQTAGTAGRDRREYYGVRRTRLIASANGVFRGDDLGDLTALDPPVRFGFSSAPPTPQLVSVTTTIDVP
jgi:hypothetical protein